MTSSKPKSEGEEPRATSSDEIPSSPPLAETIRPTITAVADRKQEVSADFAIESPYTSTETTHPVMPSGEEERSELAATTDSHIALGETLQLVRYARRGDTLAINGITPHGRSLTFEQRDARQGWYVIAAGRRRRPTKRELGLVVATITQEMEAALVPEKQAEVRSAYRLAVAADIPGMKVAGLGAYRDMLLDEAAAFTGEQTEGLSVVAVEYQAFKRFAIRHGHRIGAAFVQALGERLIQLFDEERKVHVFHKTGKAFRLIIVDHSSNVVQDFVDRISSADTKEWLVERVWGENRRTHPDEIHFHIGIANAFSTERNLSYLDLAQRLSDDAHRASKIGQLMGHTSLALAKADYRTTVYRWNISSEDEFTELASSMDDGPADVMAEMSDYLHELVSVDLEGMAVAGDINALVYCAIARDGFWQGTTAMRIAGNRILGYFLSEEPAPMNEMIRVGGFDLGDEFYGIAVEGDKLFFARGDINSAGATRVRAGLEKLHHAVGWRREDGGGVVGEFLTALQPTGDSNDLPSRIRYAARRTFHENSEDTELLVNDAVDIADYLYVQPGVQAKTHDVVDGAILQLELPLAQPREVRVISRRSGFRLLLEIDGVQLPASITDGKSGLQVKLRIKEAVASASIAIVTLSHTELVDLLAEIREENQIAESKPLDVLGFLRHIADILLQNEIKIPGKIRLALGHTYQESEFVGVFSIETIRENYPGLFYEAVHHDLLEQNTIGVDEQLRELIGHTMLTSSRPELTWKNTSHSER